MAEAKDTGKIYITISNKPMETSTPQETPQEADKKKKEDNKANALSDYAQHQFFNFIQNQATQAVSYSIQNIGNFTGDYETQRHIQETLSTLNMGKSIVMAGVGGAKYGPAGAVIGVAFATASIGINALLSYTSAMAGVNRQNYSISQLREISGLDTLSNGSR